MMKYQRWGLALAGLLILVFAIVYIARPKGHIPLYDANLVRLAETQRQGYCAGRILLVSEGAGNKAEAASCRKISTKYSDKFDIYHTQDAFCQGVVDAGWEGKKKDCMMIVSQNQYWPTYDGSITNSWNRARPYPVPVLAIGAVGASTDNSRTGGHQEQTHPSFSR